MSEQVKVDMPIIGPAHRFLHETLPAAFHSATDRIGDFINDHGQEAAAGFAVVALSVGAVACNSGAEASNETTGTTVSSFEAADAACSDTWAVVQAEHGGNRFAQDGIQEIKDAIEGSGESASTGLDAWFGVVTHDPELLAGVANATIYKSTPESRVNAADLYDETGQCVTPLAQQVATEMRAAVVTSGDDAPKVAQVPASATNSGTDTGGNIVIDSEPGISGERKGIQVTVSTPDGNETFYILARCGNLAFPGETPTGIPKGPTDENKHDDGHLPGPDVSKSQDPGTPDPNGPGVGDPNQPHNNHGYGPGEPVPTVPQEPVDPTTTVPQGPPATEGTTPPVTDPPVIVTTPPTTERENTYPSEPAMMVSVSGNTELRNTNETVIYTLNGVQVTG